MYEQSMTDPMIVCDPGTILTPDFRRARNPPPINHSYNRSPSNTPINAAFMYCPIMMLRKPANLPRRPEPSVNDMEHDNNPASIELPSDQSLNNLHQQTNALMAQLRGGSFNHQNCDRHQTNRQTASGRGACLEHHHSRVGGGTTAQQETVCHALYGSQQTAGQPYQPQQTAGQPYQTQQTAGQPYQPQQMAGQPYQPQQMAGQPYQPQQGAGLPYQPQQMAGQPYQPQEMAGQPYQPQEMAGQPYQPQQMAGQPYQPQQMAGQPYQPQQTARQPYQPQQTDGQPYQPHQAAGQPQHLARQCHHRINFRQEEKDEIKSLLLRSGHVIQICGPPMAGKSTIVRQVLDEIVASAPVPYQFDQHHFTCKTALSFQDILSTVARRLSPHLPDHQLNADNVLADLRNDFERKCRRHQVLIFHKCENLRENSSCNQFVEFMVRLVRELCLVPITIIFTSYKQFPKDRSVCTVPKNRSVRTVEIRMLSDMDITSLLLDYLPISEAVNYTLIWPKGFCFPEAVRLVAEEFLADEKCRVPCEALGKKIAGDHDLLSRLFGSRLEEVLSWIPRQILYLLTHFSHSIQNSFTEAHLEYVNSSDHDQIDLKKFINILKQNFVIWSLPGVNRLIIHPLVVYYSMTTLHRENTTKLEKWFDGTCNRYTNFLGRVLLNAEAGLQQHGKKGLVYGSLLQEKDNLRYTIQMAITCNNKTYENFLKIAVSASGFIIKCFSREASSFYWALYNSAKTYGSERELAVIEIFLGQSISDGSGKDWKVADGYLSSAINRLSKFGNSFYLALAHGRRAINYHRQGRYDDSLRDFKEARNALINVNRFALGDAFFVSETKVDEEIITQGIHEAIPIIFLGNNVDAREKLNRILNLIENSFENHPELGILFNLIGLTEQRGNRNLESAVQWYMRSYTERLYLAKLCPENLLVILNNIGVILFNLGRTDECMKYLNQALEIRRESGWVHYSTGLTLVHLAEIKLKMGQFAEAFKNGLEAERILAATVQDHDMRLRANLVLFHVRVAIRQALDSDNQVTQPRLRQAYSERLGGQQVPEYGQQVDTRVTQPMWRQACDRELVPECRGDNIPSLSRLESFTSDLDSVNSSDLFGVSPPRQGDDNYWDCGTQAGPNNYPERQAQIPAWSAAAAVTEIEPCDLQMSAEDYLDRLVQIASNQRGTLSDDGYSVILCAHEHAMLLNWGNSREKFEEHKNALIQFNPWIEEAIYNDDIEVVSRYRCLFKHKALYSYIMNTPYELLQLSEFIKHLHKACLICQFSENIFTDIVWQMEAHHCMQVRRERERRLHMLQYIRCNTQSDASSSFPAECRAFIRESDMLTSNRRFDRASPEPQLNVSPRIVRGKNECRDTTDSNVCVPGLPHFAELLSSGSSDCQTMIQQQEHASACWMLNDCHHQNLQSSSTNTGLSSFVLSRIVNDQREILQRIQSCRMSSSSSHQPLISAAGEGGQNYGTTARRRSSGETNMSSLIPDSVFREPVEHSYYGEDDPSWNSQDCLSSLDHTEIVDSNPDQHRQLLTCEHSSVTDHDLENGQEYKPCYPPCDKAPYQNDPIYKLFFRPDKIDPVDMSETPPSLQSPQVKSKSGGEMFVASEYILRSIFGSNGSQLQPGTDLSVNDTDESQSQPGTDLSGNGSKESQLKPETDLSSNDNTESQLKLGTTKTRSDTEESPQKLGIDLNVYDTKECELQLETNLSINDTREPVRNLSSERGKAWHNLLSYIGELSPSSSPTTVNISDNSIKISSVIDMSHADLPLAAGYVKQAYLVESHDSQVTGSHKHTESCYASVNFGRDVAESPTSTRDVNVLLPPSQTEQLAEPATTSDLLDLQSGSESRGKRSDSESSGVSTRSGSESASLPSCPAAHEVACMPDSGYLSPVQQMPGARPKTRSSRCYRNTGDSVSDQGFGEIPINVAEHSQPVSGVHCTRERHSANTFQNEQHEHRQTDNSRRLPVQTGMSSDFHEEEVSSNSFKSGTLIPESKEELNQ